LTHYYLPTGNGIVVLRRDGDQSVRASQLDVSKGVNRDADLAKIRIDTRLLGTLDPDIGNTIDVYLGRLDNSNCELYLPMDEGIGSRCYDHTQNWYYGTISNAEWVDGKFGYGLYFNGSDYYVRISDSDSLKPTSEITLEAYFTVNDYTLDLQTIMMKWEGYWVVYKWDSVNPYIEFKLIGTDDVTRTCDNSHIVGTWNIQNDTWYHVVCTYDGTYMRVYIDGTLYQEANVGSFTIKHSTTDLVLGQKSTLTNEFLLRGKLDEVRVWSVARSSSEVSNLTRYSRHFPKRVFSGVIQGIKKTVEGQVPRWLDIAAIGFTDVLNYRYTYGLFKGQVHEILSDLVQPLVDAGKLVGTQIVSSTITTSYRTTEQTINEAVNDFTSKYSYEYYVSDERIFRSFPRGSLVSSYTLDTIFDLEYEKSDYNIINTQTVLGAMNKTTGSDADYTESTIGWSVGTGYTLVESNVAREGNKSILCRTQFSTFDPTLTKVFDSTLNLKYFGQLEFYTRYYCLYDALFDWVNEDMNIQIRMYTDDSNYFQRTKAVKGFEVNPTYDNALALDTNWIKVEVPFNTTESSEWTAIGSPTWEEITKIEFKLQFLPTVSQYLRDFYIDGMWFTKGFYHAVKVDSESVSKYGERRGKLIQKGWLDSDQACLDVATAIVDAYKDPIESVRSVSTPGELHFNVGTQYTITAQDIECPGVVRKIEHSLVDGDLVTRIELSPVEVPSIESILTEAQTRIKVLESKELEEKISPSAYANFVTGPIGSRDLMIRMTGDNLLLHFNPSFEDDIPQNGYPDSWYLEGPLVSDYILYSPGEYADIMPVSGAAEWGLSTISYEGTLSVYLDTTNNAGTIVSSPVPLLPDTQYQAEVAIYDPNNIDGKIVLYYLDSSYSTITMSVVKSNVGTGSWDRYSGIVTTPSNVKYGRLGLTSVGSGVIYFDYVGLRRVWESIPEDQEKLQPGFVNTELLEDLCVTTDKLANYAVTALKLGAGAVTGSKLKKGCQPYISSVVFAPYSGDEHDSVSWSSGYIKFADGTTQSISSGSFTNLDAGTHYIYFTVGSSSLSRTTDYANTVGDDRGLLCMVVVSSDTGQQVFIQPFYTKGWNVNADVLAANAVLAEHIKAGEIVVGHLDSSVENRLFSSSSDRAIVEGWKYTGTTYIDGGDIYTDTVTAVQIKAGEVKTEHVRFDVKTSDPSPLETGMMWYRSDQNQLRFRSDEGTEYIPKFPLSHSGNVDVAGATKTLVLNAGFGSTIDVDNTQWHTLRSGVCSSVSNAIDLAYIETSVYRTAGYGHVEIRIRANDTVLYDTCLYFSGDLWRYLLDTTELIDLSGATITVEAYKDDTGTVSLHSNLTAYQFVKHQHSVSGISDHT